MTDSIELGLDTFGDVTLDADGQPLPHSQVLRHVVAEAVLADQVGLHFFGVGEHHRKDFAVSAPEVVLAAIAGQTSRIRLGSAVTVLSSDDPVRVYQRFSTLNALSNGRAEVIVGRGSFTESFPLFGFDMSQYELLFEERLELFAALLSERPVTWSGRTRAPLREQTVYPPIDPGSRLRAWVGVGGSPESVTRAARHGLPLMLAIIGGSPRRFAPYVELFHRALAQSDRGNLPVGAHSPGHVAATDEQAREELWPHYLALMTRIGAERGWPPATRAQFEREAGPDGALCVGSPETVAKKIAATVQALGLARFDMKYSNGTLPHEAQMTSIELYGTKVAPRVRQLLDV
jgi:probable LLM family oxidoreductase